MNTLETKIVDCGGGDSDVVEKEEEDEEEKSLSSVKYETHDRNALLKLLLERDELLAKNLKDFDNLQRDFVHLKEENKHLVLQIHKLNQELQMCKNTQNHENEKETNLNIENGSNYILQGNQVLDDDDKPMPDWKDSETGGAAMSSISDLVRATAEAEWKNMETDFSVGTEDINNHVEDTNNHGEDTNSEYVYDVSSGYYYHPSTGYYWDPNSGLFYDYTSGNYYLYNEASGEYEVHSQADIQKESISSNKSGKKSKLSSESSCDKTKKNKRTKRKVKKVTSKDSTKSSSMRNSKCKLKQSSLDVEDKMISDSENESSGSLATDESELVSDPESGEIISSDSSDVEIVDRDAWREKDYIWSERVHTVFDGGDSNYQSTEAMTENYPPCIRVVVQESENLCAGTLFIVTCAGGTIGRDTCAGHTIEIPDIGVSKFHASIEYDHDASCYKVTDQGSQNGTRVNGSRLCQIKSESGCHPVSHGDMLQLGTNTKLLLHIHKGHDTCEDCEPGQIQARLKASNPVKNTHVVLTKEERRQQQRKELKCIKKKFGLQNSHFENDSHIHKNADYTDKAYLRRKFIGSENEVKRTDSPASVHSPIASSNKGHKLLAKMGWKEGQGLGKTSTGIAEPINVELRVNRSAGLGSSAGISLSLDNVQNSSKAKRWSQAQERFNRLQSSSNSLGEIDSISSHKLIPPNDRFSCKNKTTPPGNGDVSVVTVASSRSKDKSK